MEHLTKLHEIWLDTRAMQSDHAERSVHSGDASFAVALHRVGSAGASGRSPCARMVNDIKDVGADDGNVVGR